MKFWIIEKGRVIFICPVPDPEADPKTAKKEIVKSIVAAIKECQEQ